MAAPNQAGVFGGKDPSAYNPSDPVVLFIIQVIGTLDIKNCSYLISSCIQGMHHSDLQPFVSCPPWLVTTATSYC